MILFFALLILASVFSAKVTNRFGIPVLFAFLAVGVIVGSDGLNLFYFNDAKLTKKIADLILIFVLFDGGFRTTRKQLHLVAMPALTLATLGVIITAVVLGAFIHLVMHYDFITSMMIASIIASTDAAAVFLITKQNPIQGRLAATLNVESAANDPMAILLTLAFVSLLAGQSSTPLEFVGNLLWQFSGGVLIGFLMSHAARFLFDHLEVENRGYYYVLIVGVILLTYGAADFIRANGIIAVFFMGYWLGNSSFVGKRGVSNFLEGIATFGTMALFVMLGLLAFPSHFVNIWKEGLLIVVLMVFMARPIAVLISTFPFHYPLKERGFLMWGGIKGAVPIVLATYPAAYGLDPNGNVFNIIFFAVIFSCLVQGSTLGPLAKFLKLTGGPKQQGTPFSVELHSVKKSDLDVFEFYIRKDTDCVGKTIIELGLYKDVVITSIVRKGKIIPPKGDVKLYEEDILFILAPVKLIKPLAALLNKGKRIEEM